MVRYELSEAWGNRQASAKSLMVNKVIAKSISATKDKTKYPADLTKGETGDAGARAATTHERSAAEAYERCGLSRKTAIALVEKGMLRWVTFKVWRLGRTSPAWWRLCDPLVMQPTDMLSLHPLNGISI